jgi:hypothetical protein
MPYERLEETVRLIARHPDDPGKHEVIAGCLEDIEDRWRQGQITLRQRLRLYGILLRATVSCRSPAMAR